MTDTAIEQRDDEAIAEAIVSGRSLRSLRKEFGLSTAELDALLEKCWPIDTASRLRMIKADVGKLDKLTEVFFSKAILGDTQSGLVTIKILERRHELLGMNSAARIEIVQAPPEREQGFEKIYQAIIEVARGADGAVDALSHSNSAEPNH